MAENEDEPERMQAAWIERGRPGIQMRSRSTVTHLLIVVEKRTSVGKVGRWPGGGMFPRVFGDDCVKVRYIFVHKRVGEREKV